MADKAFKDTEFEFDDSLDSELDNINLDDFDLDDDEFGELDDIEGLDDFDFEDDSNEDTSDNSNSDNVINIDDINSGDIDIGISEYELEQEVLRELEESNSLDADLDGTILKNDSLMEDIPDVKEDNQTGFISDTEILL